MKVSFPYTVYIQKLICKSSDLDDLYFLYNICVNSMQISSIPEDAAQYIYEELGKFLHPEMKGGDQ